MKLAITVSWFFEVIAGLLAVLSLYASGWFLNLLWADIRGPRLSAGPGGMPGNTGAGVGLAIGLAVGLVAAALAFVVGTLALPADKTTAAWKFGKIVQKASLVGLVSLIAWVVLGLVLE